MFVDRIKDFIVIYGPDCRKRHYHRQTKDKITEFCLQLEIYHRGKWHGFIRYDTAHGFSHRDVIHSDGKIEKIPLGIADYNEALTFAQIDIETNWRRYRDRFFKEARDENE